MVLEGTEWEDNEPGWSSAPWDYGSGDRGYRKSPCFWEINALATVCKYSFHHWAWGTRMDGLLGTREQQCLPQRWLPPEISTSCNGINLYASTFTLTVRGQCFQAFWCSCQIRRVTAKVLLSWMESPHDTLHPPIGLKTSWVCLICIYSPSKQ